MKTVQILGLAPNLENTPDIGPFILNETERWCSNHHRSYRIKFRPAMDTWTRWFNMHTMRHISLTYPGGLKWYTQQTKPIYLQEATPSIPSSLTFPRQAIQAYFSIDGTPFQYFTGSVCWLTALAIYEKFERIEFHGFWLRRGHLYEFERPGFFYWVEVARQHGIEVYIPPEVELGPPGDPRLYTGPLYGFQPHSERYKRTF